MNWRGFRAGTGLPRHITANRARGSRARSHLSKARDRERRVLARRSRQRERRRERGGAIDPLARRRRAAWMVGGLAVGLIAALLSANAVWRSLATEFGAIESIAVQGQVHLDSLQVANATGVLRGSSLAAVNAERIEARLNALPWIEKSDVVALPPHTLLVRVHERRPRARLRSSSGARADRLVDLNGTPFDGAHEATNWPVIIGGDALASDRSHPVLTEAIAILGNLEQTHLGGLTIPGQSVMLEVPREAAAEGWVVHGRNQVILGTQNLDHRLHRLNQLLEAGVASAHPDQAPVRIDLRFEGQAVLANAEHPLKEERG